MPYRPPEDVLERYADVLVNFALGKRKGIRPGDVVLLTASKPSTPLYLALQTAVLRAGGTTIGDFTPAGAARLRLETATLEQLSKFNRAYYRGLAATIDHHVTVLPATGPHELEGIDTAKLLQGRRTVKPYRNWLDQKEYAGRYSWTLALYGTPAMAKDARMSLESYWAQIIDACFLDDPDPIRRWREAFREIDRIKRKLDRMEIDRLHVEGDFIDLRFTVGGDRRWLGASGHNIPSFEVFTSPNWRGTEGTVSFDLPLHHRYGGTIEGVSLTFERGAVVEATARRDQEMLRAMVASDPGASRVGEISLTDGRLSRITRFMGSTLYDENRGGPQGNFHLALGSAYREAFAGDVPAQKPRDWQRLGFNESSVHTDIVTTARRRATAVLPSGRTKVIYDEGRFTV
jgi:aminopeptidase